MSAQALIVFARLPRLGEVKSRLAAELGEPAALAIYRELLERTLSLAAGFAGARGFLCLTGADPHGEGEVLATRYGLTLTRQVEDPDLGVRMREALAERLADTDRVVLIGCDCPVFDRLLVAQAFERLQQIPAVFGPTEDGGYALVGVTQAIGRNLPRLFEGVVWGGETVMDQTRQRCAQAGVRIAELPTVWDVDVPADWRRWQALQSSSDRRGA